MSANLFYIHGKDSGPWGVRARLFRDRFPSIATPALTNDLEWRVQALDILLQRPSIIVASSLGGLTALQFCRTSPKSVAGMLLIAPAVGFNDPDYDTPEINDALAELVIPPEIPTIVIAGRHDAVIPLSSIQDLVERSMHSRLEFHVLDDDHLLHRPASLDLQIRSIARLIGCDTPTGDGTMLSIAADA